MCVCVCAQGSQYGVAVSRLALPGTPQPRLDFDASVEVPQQTAANAATQFVRNIPPEVRRVVTFWPCRGLGMA